MNSLEYYMNSFTKTFPKEGKPYGFAVIYQGDFDGRPKLRSVHAFTTKKERDYTASVLNGEEEALGINAWTIDLPEQLLTQRNGIQGWPQEWSSRKNHLSLETMKEHFPSAFKEGELVGFMHPFPNRLRLDHYIHSYRGNYYTVEEMVDAIRQDLSKEDALSCWQQFQELPEDIQQILLKALI